MDSAICSNTVQPSPFRGAVSWSFSHRCSSAGIAKTGLRSSTQPQPRRFVATPYKTASYRRSWKFSPDASVRSGGSCTWCEPMSPHRLEESDQSGSFVRVHLGQQADDLKQRLASPFRSRLPLIVAVVANLNGFQNRPEEYVGILPRVILIGLGLATVQARSGASRILRFPKLFAVNRLRSHP